MFDLIEHVVHPPSELERARELLSSGGILVINTPDIGSLYARLLGLRWHLVVPPEHLYYFNRIAMRRVLEAHGFEVLSITTIGKSFTLPYIFKTLYAWQGLQLWQWLADKTSRGLLARVSLPINLHDNMFVIARKK